MCNIQHHIWNVLNCCVTATSGTQESWDSFSHYISITIQKERYVHPQSHTSGSFTNNNSKERYVHPPFFHSSSFPNQTSQRSLCASAINSLYVELTNNVTAFECQLGKNAVVEVSCFEVWTCTIILKEVVFMHSTPLSEKITELLNRAKEKAKIWNPVGPLRAKKGCLWEAPVSNFQLRLFKSWDSR